MAKVDIVKVKNPSNFESHAHRVVEGEKTGCVLQECGI